MGWLIFGVIALCIVLFLLKNAYFTRTKKWNNGIFLVFEYSDKFEMPLWLFFIIIIISFIPILNIFGFFAAMFLIIGHIACDELFIHFENTTIWHKIGEFFNKKIF